MFKRRIRHVILAAAVVLAVGASAGCAASGDPGEGNKAEATTVTVPFSPEPKSLNPNWQSDSGGFYPSGNIYSRLIDLDWGAVEAADQESTVYPDLAETWDVSADGRTFTFHLHKGVVWHDGVALTSDDVVYTYETIIEKNYPLAAYLKGAHISAPDSDTVVISFDDTNVAFIPLLAQASNWYGAILPKHVYEGTDWSTNEANMKPIGSGPFKFVSWQSGSQITLAANEKYFLGAPDLKSLTFTVVTDSQVAKAGFDAGTYPYLTNDFISNFPQLKQLAASGGDPQVVTTPSLYDRSLYFNLKNSILANHKVREALAYGVDRDGINSFAFSGLWTPMYTAGLSSYTAFLNKDAQFPQHDLAKANQLLDDAGYPVKADGTRFTLRLTNYGVTDSKLIAQVLVEQFKELSINLDWQQYDVPTWLNKLSSGDFDISTYFVRYGPDPAAYGEHFATGSPRDFMGYSNADVDSWLDEAKQSTNNAVRKSLYDKVQAQLVADLPYLPLFGETKFSLVHKGWEGFPTQADAYNKAMGWFGYYQVRKQEG